MPRLVLKVERPRWSGADARYQQPGEQIVLDIDNMEEFKRQVLLHSTHCVIVEGELPDFSVQPSFLSKVVNKAKEVVSGLVSKPEPEFSTFAEMKAADKAEDAAKADSKAQAQEEAKVAAEREAHPQKCPDCQHEFKSLAALEKHFKRSGHGKNEQAEEADAE